LAKKPYSSMATRRDGTTTTTNALAITLALWAWQAQDSSGESLSKPWEFGSLAVVAIRLPLSWVCETVSSATTNPHNRRPAGQPAAFVSPAELTQLPRELTQLSTPLSLLWSLSSSSLTCSQQDPAGKHDCSTTNAITKDYTVPVNSIFVSNYDFRLLECVPADHGLDSTTLEKLRNGRGRFRKESSFRCKSIIVTSNLCHSFHRTPNRQAMSSKMCIAECSATYTRLLPQSAHSFFWPATGE
jgi:hypothetical protein